MNRCKTWAAMLCVAASTLLSPTLHAQTSNSDGVREFPKAAMRAEMVVTAPPEITMNGKVDRLSPGSRIRDTQSRLVLSGSIVGREFTVNYTRDAAGLVHEVWILTAAEAKERRRGSAPARNFIFDSDPKPLDPNTPFDKLPKFPQH